MKFPSDVKIKKDRMVDLMREGQLTKEPRESSRQRRAEETSWREIAVQRKDGQQKEAVRD